MTAAPTVLMLQGPLGPLYGQIAGHLRTAGCNVLRVQFSGNDVADWPHAGALEFTQPFSDWERFLDTTIAPLGVDVMLLHGDRRPYHRVATDWARRRGIAVFVSELGYMRPDWMILERDGVSALSRFPSDPARIRQIAAESPDIDLAPRWTSRIWPRVVGELRFSLFNTLYARRFPHYQSHRDQSAWRVYPGWVFGQVRRRFRQIHPLPTAPYYVFALQLDGDYQIRDHSPYDDVRDSIVAVARSFAAHAPRKATLVIKPHPHSFAIGRVRATLRQVCQRFGLDGRLRMIKGATVAELCNGAAGFVSVNSSAGFEALDASCPTHAIMPTLYDVPGLTHQGDLDAFWAAPRQSDKDLFSDLVKAICHTVQVRGTIYHPDGCRHAAAAMARRMIEWTAKRPTATPPDPARLIKAADMGVRYD
ncbi:capsular biosynthesis protein [Thalassococcus sp. BH17M4-6]|uniref:capsular polysaccharide export protein, LipB/KpsS family n=1 Tax=Thalassococcus sp. BH17M4-6 TaxID=3413148 RepID=UPI003BC58746